MSATLYVVVLAMLSHMMKVRRLVAQNLSEFKRQEIDAVIIPLNQAIIAAENIIRGDKMVNTSAEQIAKWRQLEFPF